MNKFSRNTEFDNNLEEVFKNISQADYALATTAARNGLYLIIKSLNLSGTEVILPGFICASIPAVLMRLNVKPVFVDVDQSFTIKTDDIEDVITENTSAIIVVHTYGNPAEIKRISGIAKEKNLVLIEDLAHNIGGKYKGRHLGSFSDYSIYSLPKHIISYEGGIVTTDNKERYETLKKCLDEINEKKIGLFHNIYILQLKLYRGIVSINSHKNIYFLKLIHKLIKNMFIYFSNDNQPVDNKFINDFKINKFSLKFCSTQLKNFHEILNRRKINFNKHKNRYSSFRQQEIRNEISHSPSYFAILNPNKLDLSKDGFIKAWPNYHIRSEYTKKYGFVNLPMTEHLAENLYVKAI